jgi:hypothetical protein
VCLYRYLVVNNNIITSPLSLSLASPLFELFPCSPHPVYFVSVCDSGCVHARVHIISRFSVHIRTHTCTLRTDITTHRSNITAETYVCTVHQSDETGSISVRCRSGQLRSRSLSVSSCLSSWSFSCYNHCPSLLSYGRTFFFSCFSFFFFYVERNKCGAEPDGASSSTAFSKQHPTSVLQS